MAPARPTKAHINFGDDSFYVGGFGLPEGYYALYFNFNNFQPTDRTTGAPKGASRLGVMVDAFPISPEGVPTGEEGRQQFYGLGTKANLSFAPDPDNPKQLVAVPGGPAAGASKNTNWDVLRQSMIDCGLPNGVLVDDLAAIDGMWAHMTNIPEPEERKSFARTAATGEAAMNGQVEERKGSGVISVVGEILEGGKPWEGGGGLEQKAAAPAPARVAPKPPTPPAKPGPKAVAPRPPVAVAPAAEEQGEVDEDLETAAVHAVSAVLEKNPNGLTKVLLRTGTFKAAKAAAEAAGLNGDEVASNIAGAYFKSDEHLLSLLGPLSYKIDGAKVVPA